MPSLGETWRSTASIGKEITPGTAVAATRRLYVTNPVLTSTRESRRHEFATGTRDNVRAVTQGPQVAGGSLNFPLSADEIIEWLLIGMAGGVTPTPDGSGQLWTFTPSEDVDSATVQVADGANEWRETGVRVNQLTIAGSANGENLCTLDLYGLNRELNALTTGLDERTPEFFEGFETLFYIDPFGDAPGTTLVPGTLINWNLVFMNNLGRKYTADNTNNQRSTPIGKIGVEATLTFEANESAAAAEVANWEDVVYRTIRLSFGNNHEIGAGPETSYVKVDLPLAWSALDISGEDAQTRTYQFQAGYVYDPDEIAAGVRVLVRNGRTTAFGS